MFVLFDKRELLHNSVVEYFAVLMQVRANVQHLAVTAQDMQLVSTHIIEGTPSVTTLLTFQSMSYDDISACFLKSYYLICGTLLLYVCTIFYCIVLCNNRNF